ncbi:MAG: DUF1700 domain-containing protein [Clostridia bacterium]|nr:DUF1700 domain-containing protein [Clostridia bacterium]
MTKYEFLSALERELKEIPASDRKRFLDYYAEMIDDRIEESGEEERAVADIGAPSAVAQQILEELGADVMRESAPPSAPNKRTWKPWEIILLILGSPLWIALLAAGFVILLSVYIVLWTAPIVLWAIVASLAAVCMAGIFSCPIPIIAGKTATGVLLLGGGLLCGGLAILLFLGSLQVSRGFGILSKTLFLKIKRLFVGKEK